MADADVLVQGFSEDSPTGFLFGKMECTKLSPAPSRVE
jgi:hypothetical protein